MQFLNEKKGNNSVYGKTDDFSRHQHYVANTLGQSLDKATNIANSLKNTFSTQEEYR